VLDLLTSLVDPAGFVAHQAAVAANAAAAPTAPAPDPASDAAAAANTAAGGTAVSAEARAATEARAEELSAYVLERSQAAAAAVVDLLCFSLGWQDSSAAHAAAAAAQRLLPRARGVPHLQVLVVRGLLPVAVAGIRDGPAAGAAGAAGDGDRETGLLNLVREIYTTLAPVCPAVGPTLAECVGAEGPEALAELHQVLARSGGSKKGQRGDMLKLLRPAGAATNGANGGAGRERVGPTLPDSGLLAMYRRPRGSGGGGGGETWTEAEAGGAWAWLENWT
jgi:hypothetical protein